MRAIYNGAPAMPTLPPKQCSYPNCKEYTTKQGRCDQHQPEPWTTSKGRTASQRGYGYQWTKTRAQALKRDAYLCQVCLKDGIYTQATEVDHIRNKASGGDDSLSNLQSICSTCHKEKTQGERKRV